MSEVSEVPDHIATRLRFDGHDPADFVVDWEVEPCSNLYSGTHDCNECDECFFYVLAVRRKKRKHSPERSILRSFFSRSAPA